MMTTPEEADAMTREQLYARLIETEADRNNLRAYIHESSGKGAEQRQRKIVAAIRSEGAVA